MNLARRATQEVGPDVQVDLDDLMVEAARSMPHRDPRRPVYGLGVLAADFELVAEPPARAGPADAAESAAAGEARGVTFSRMQQEITKLRQRVDDRERRLDERERALEARIAAMEADLAALRRARGDRADAPPHVPHDDDDVDIAWDD